MRAGYGKRNGEGRMKNAESIHRLALLMLESKQTGDVAEESWLCETRSKLQIGKPL
jgi:hypothetical protein